VIPADNPIVKPDRQIRELERETQQGPLTLVPLSAYFKDGRVKVELAPEEFPGYKSERVVCEACGEGINFRREVRAKEKVLCRACAGERYYEPI